VSGALSTDASAGRRRRLDAITGGDVAFPLAVLFAIFFFDEWDTASFNTLAPDIRNAFHLTTNGFGLIVVVNLTITLALAIPLGFIGDRVRRTRLVVALAVVAGLFSFLTGLTVALWAFVLFRLGNGIGRLANDTIHPSLLSDYYQPVHRAPVFAAHRNAVYLGAIVGAAVAGTVSALAGWRVAFLILIVPVVAAALVALRLRDPKRGGTDDPEMATAVSAEAPVPFGEASRTLLGVPTLKRQYVAWLFIGAGLIPLAYLLPLYLERVFHVGDFPRGVITAANAAFTFAGVVVGGRWTRSWLARDEGMPLRHAGLSLAGVGVGLALVGASPWLGLSIGVGLATSFVAGVFFAPFFTVQALVSPPRVRTLSFGFGSLFLVGGAWLLYFLPGFGAMADHHGYRVAIAALLPYWVIGGLVLRSAGRFVAVDAARAARTMAVAVALRRQRETAGAHSLLVCAGVDVAYDGVQVLFGVDLEVDQGEIVALLGTNGAGKSTLLKAISGLVDPSGGAIFFGGRDITHLGAEKAAELGIIQMPGGRSVFPTLTVDESLRLAAWLYQRDDPNHVRQATAQVREFFPRLLERRDTLAGDLSGGEQQMLGLAMAFIAKPELLMIDELTLGLAPTVVEQLVDIVRRIHAAGTTVIIVEQSVNVALLLAHRAVFMEKGEVRFSGPTAELLERRDIVRSVFLEGAASLEPRARGGRRAALRKPPAPAATAAPVLELHGVSRRFGGIVAVDGVDLVLREGEILGMIGPNGAGKTTVTDLVSGYLRCDAGRIVLLGEDVTGWTPDRRARHGLGRSFQDARLFPSMTVAENIAIGLERHLQIRDPLAAALGLPEVRESEDDVAWAVHDLIELLGLGAFRNKFLGELSTGSRRIVDLALAIAHRPSVLLLDEPSSGIAQRETEALAPLLLRIQAETGCSMLVIEHDMPLITSLAHRLVALELGAVVTEGEPADVIRHPEVVASYLGTNEDAIARSSVAGPAPATAGNGRRSSGKPGKAGATSRSGAAGR
jgi:ABC-type branched-subunit amino acid transport system ATPase component/predicted MFS family arabinose efflux permease